MNKIALGIFRFAGCVWVASFPTGCSSQPNTYKGGDGLESRETERIERVWVAEGFDFSGYDTILITETKSEAETKDEKEADRMASATRNIPRGLADTIDLKEIVPNVALKQDDVKAGAKLLKLDTTISDFDRGSTGMRVMFGRYGAGRARLTVRGRVVDAETGRPFLIVEDESSGDFFGPTSGGSSEAVQKLALDWASFLSKVKKQEKIEYKD